MRQTVDPSGKNVLWYLVGEGLAVRFLQTMTGLQFIRQVRLLPVPQAPRPSVSTLRSHSLVARTGIHVKPAHMHCLLFVWKGSLLQLFQKLIVPSFVGLYNKVKLPQSPLLLVPYVTAFGKTMPLFGGIGSRRSIRNTVSTQS